MDLRTFFFGRPAKPIITPRRRVIEEPAPVNGLDLPKLLEVQRGGLAMAIQQRERIEREQARMKLAYEFEAARLDEALRQTVTVILAQKAAINIMSNDPALPPSSSADVDDFSDLDSEFEAAMTVSEGHYDEPEWPIDSAGVPTFDNPGRHSADDADEDDGETARVEKLIGARS